MMNPHDPSILQNQILNYMDVLYVDGYGPEVGKRLVAGIQALYPRYSRHGDLTLPRVRRAAQGWERLVPPRSRWPVPWGVVAAAAVWLARNVGLQFCLAMILAYQCYLRPSEVATLRVRSLVPPSANHPEGPRSHYSIVIREEVDLEPTKTRTYDDSVLLDRPDLKWMNRLWGQLRRHRRPDDLLFAFDQEEFARAVKRSFEAVGADELGAVAYSLGHGGASWDDLMKYRSLAEVKARGRWRADSSVVRYQKASKVMAALDRLDPQARRHAEFAEENLEQLLADPMLRTVPFGGN